MILQRFRTKAVKIDRINGRADALAKFPVPLDFNRAIDGNGAFIASRYREYTSGNFDRGITDFYCHAGHEGFRGCNDPNRSQVAAGRCDAGSHPASITTAGILDLPPATAGALAKDLCAAAYSQSAAEGHIFLPRAEAAVDR